jgi:hypothetical protein
VRSLSAAVVLWLFAAACGPAKNVCSLGGDGDHSQPALVTLVDGNEQLWVVAGYSNIAEPVRSQMGLSIRDPGGAWTTSTPLVTDSGLIPSGDAAVAATQHGGRAYYVSLLGVMPRPDYLDEQAIGLALATVDVENGAVTVAPPRRIDLGDWPHWDEPTIAATHPPGAHADTVIAAGTPTGDDYQDVVSILVSHDGGVSFHEVGPLLAPDSPGRVYGRRDNTVIRPSLVQDPRPGFECHTLISFGVYYGTALLDTPGIAPPACLTEINGCRSIAESESNDCGETWSPPRYIAIDTGMAGGLDFRGFGYTIGTDGTRLVIFGDEDADNAPILVKRAAPHDAFKVVQYINGQPTWGDGSPERVVEGPSISGLSVRRWRPAVAASGGVGAVWIEEDVATHDASIRFALSTTNGTGQWSPGQIVDDEAAGVVCDAQIPEDDYIGIAPGAAFGDPTWTFVVAWTEFAPCGAKHTRRVDVASVR